MPERSTDVDSPAGASAAAIRFHYDLGDAFYALWLDPLMVYSCALFEPGDDLARAQVRKLDHHIAEARATGCERVLDVGCGWGALLRRLVREAGVGRAVGLTPSENQAARIRASAPPAVEVRCAGWQDHQPDAPFGAIVSIGAFEHFARLDMSPAQCVRAYRRFFRFCHRNLRPGGRLSLQAICSEPGADADPSFLSEAIFPESRLPREAEVLDAADGLFDVVRLRRDASDYQRTCRTWYANLDRRRVEAVALVGEPRVRDYLHFLQIGAAMFRTRNADLLRITFQRIEAAPASGHA